MPNRSLIPLLVLGALVALVAVSPTTARAQGCQTCLEIPDRADVCDFCPAGETCFEDCKHDVLGNCYVTGENCPEAQGPVMSATFFEGAQPGEAFRLAGGTVFPLDGDVSVHVGCSGEILGVLEDSVIGLRYLARADVDPQWLRRAEARLWMASWML